MAKSWEAIAREQADTLLSQQAVLTSFEKKFEVVKKLVEEGPYPHMNTWEDYQRAVDDWLGKMMNVLEAEI